MPLSDFANLRPPSKKDAAVLASGALSVFLSGYGTYAGYLSPGSSPAVPVFSLVAGAASLVPCVLRRTSRALFAPALLGTSVSAGALFGRLLLYLSAPIFASAAPYVPPETLLSAERGIALLPALFALLLSLALLARNGTDTLSSPSGRTGPLDVIVCRTGAGPVAVKHMDRYLHTLVVGTTGTGKTSRVLKPMIWQDLVSISKGERLGITVIEPKGDFARDVAGMCRALGVRYVHIDPEDPESARFNPMEGDPDDVAEIMRTVLRSLFGRQEAFFRLNQEIAARNTALLVKRIKGDEATMLDMVNLLRDEGVLRASIEALERREGPSALTQYFRSEVLGQLKEKIHQFTLGLRLQLEDITGNRILRRLLIGKSDVDLNAHLSEGGVLIVNTAMGTLKKLGDAFGQFVMMHFQQAVFQRPGDEWTRTPHVLYVDEFPRYVNPDFERLLAIGRSYRCAAVLAVQTTSQLSLEERPEFREIVLETCRNKIVLNLGSAEDARHFSRDFGEVEVTERPRTYRRSASVLLPWRAESLKEEKKSKQRFPYTKLMELPKFRGVVRVVRDGHPQVPVLGTFELCPWDREKRRCMQGRLSVQPDALEGVTEPGTVL